MQAVKETDLEPDLARAGDPAAEVTETQEPERAERPGEEGTGAEQQGVPKTGLEPDLMGIEVREPETAVPAEAHEPGNDLEPDLMDKEVHEPET